MARIRSIKPEFWTDEKLVTLSPFARLVFIGLWNFVDDYGRVPYSPGRLKMQILPADPIDFPPLLAEISGVGLVSIYTVDNVEYLQVNGFVKHQKIDKRAASKNPPPPNPAESRRIPPEKPLEGKGMEVGGERKGKEGKEEAAPQVARVLDDEADLFRRGKEVLGNSSGGLIKKLLTAKKGKVPLARAAIEASTEKENPREYIGGIIKKRDGPDDLRERGEAW